MELDHYSLLYDIGLVFAFPGDEDDCICFTDTGIHQRFFVGRLAPSVDIRAEEASCKNGLPACGEHGVPFQWQRSVASIASTGSCTRQPGRFNSGSRSFTGLEERWQETDQETLGLVGLRRVETTGFIQDIQARPVTGKAETFCFVAGYLAA